MEILTGANGTLGSYLADLPDTYLATRSKLDVSKRDHVRIQFAHHQPSVIIHTAGLTSLEACEKNPKKAMFVNAMPSFYLSEFAPDNALIIYISSAQVFGTEGGQMPEENHLVFKPTNQYAWSKFYGENFLLQNRRKKQKVVIIRTSWLFGAGGNKFVEKIIESFSKGESVAAVDDIRGQPTYAKDLAAFIRTIVENKDKLFEENILHFSNLETASRFDIAVEIKNKLGFNNKLSAVSKDYFPSSVTRPTREYMSMEKTMAAFPEFPYRPWRESLHEYLNENSIS